MSHDQWLLLIFAIGLAAAQYGLITLALKDMRWRAAQGESVTFGWFLVVVCLPIVGPLWYGMDDQSRFYDQFGRAAGWSRREVTNAASWAKQSILELHHRSTEYWNAANQPRSDDDQH